MRCPFCQKIESRVLESRSADSGRSVRRRRQCLSCSRRFTTYERIEFAPIATIKRDGTRELFDRSKVLRGLVRACEKTTIPPERLEAIVDEIEAQLQQQSRREISTSEIGERVLEYLREMSEVAYIRFASVYGQFQGIRDFVEALERLKADSNEAASAAKNEDDGEAIDPRISKAVKTSEEFTEDLKSRACHQIEGLTKRQDAKPLS